MSDSESRTFTPQKLADRDSLIRGSGSRAAWMDLMCRFDPEQRQRIANWLAHDWTISAVELQSVMTTTDGFAQRVVATKRVQDIFVNGPSNPAVVDAEDDSATLVALHAEGKRLELNARLDAETLKGIEQALRQALDAFKKAGPEGIYGFINAIEEYAAPAAKD